MRRAEREEKQAACWQPGEATCFTGEMKGPQGQWWAGATSPLSPTSPPAPVYELPPVPAPGGWPAQPPCTLAARGVRPAERMSAGVRSLGCLSSPPARLRPVGAAFSDKPCCYSWAPISAPSSYPSGLGVVAAPPLAGPRAHWFPLVVLTGTALLQV